MLTVCGITVDLIEIFAYNVLVQEVETGNIYLVPICEIEQKGAPKAEEPQEESNIISMRGWKEWQENETNNVNFRKARIRRKVKESKCQVISLRARA
jgi:hypothetical protein